MKKFLSLFLSLVTIVTLTVPTFASESEASAKETQSKMIALDNYFEDVEYLDKNEILTVIDLQIQGYLSTEIENASEVLSAGDTFIDLYDLDGNLFAYLVPLIQDSEYCGYIIVGAIKDGFSTYYISLSKEKMQSIFDLLTSPTALSDADNLISENYIKSSLIFLPPQNLILRQRTNSYDRFYDIDSGQEVTDIIINNKTNINKSYALIRSNEHQEEINEMLTTPISALAGSAEGASLMGVRRFVPVNTDNETSYGGSQSWFSSRYARNNGCGPVAAANILCYIANWWGNDYQALYPYDTLDYSDFICHMENVYDALDPAIWGMASYGNWAKKLLNYASDLGVTMNYSAIYGDVSRRTAGSFIIRGLDLDSPVAALNANLNIDSYDLNWHWITITKYYEDSQSSWIKISSYGESVNIDFDVYHSFLREGPQSGYLYLY